MADPQVEQFLRKGFLLLPPSSSALELHRAIYAKAFAINAKGPAETWRLADGVLAAIPELNHVIEQPQVQQALTAVLGEHYLLHGHRHLHVSASSNQMWHKDSYWGFRKVRKHRPRWCMLLYYPQETVISMGPTCILSGSQYWTKDTEYSECGEDILLPHSGEQSMFLPAGSVQEQMGVLNEARVNYLAQYSGLVEDLALTVPAGSCVLMHYDLFHRASCRLNGTAPVRFLVKFQFLRTVEPSADVRCTSSVPRLLAPKVPNAHLDPIVEDINAWLAGGNAKISLPLSERAQLAQRLQSPNEVERLAAAYRLGQVGARQVLLAALHDSEAVARCAAYGLVASGPDAASAVLRLLKAHQSNRPCSYFPASSRLRRLSAFIVGEAGRPDVATILALGDALREEFCIEALGEMLEALGYLGARARAQGQDELCHLCMQQVLPFLDTPVPKCQVGQSAAYAILLAAGPQGEAPPHVLAHLAQVLEVTQDHLLAHFAEEVLRRSGDGAVRSTALLCNASASGSAWFAGNALKENTWTLNSPSAQQSKVRRLDDEMVMKGSETPQTRLSGSMGSSPGSPGSRSPTEIVIPLHMDTATRW